MTDNFFNWLFRPAEEIIKDNIKEAIKEVKEEEDDEEEDETITSVPTIPRSNKMILYRPETFDEYIGQDRAKTILRQYIQAIKKRNIIFPHTLLYSAPGMGKTTLARIIAKELGVNFLSTISSDLEDIETFENLLIRCRGGVLLLDEIHSLPRVFAEKLYPIIEDFSYNGHFIKPFTLIGATTEIGEIIKKKKPFYDRFKIKIELDYYTLANLVTIGKQYREKMFANDNLAEHLYFQIATNCRDTPRILINLIEATIYFEGKIEEVLKNFGILKEGFTIKDVQVLEIISTNSKGIGLQAIGAYLDTSVENYLYNIEPFLLRKGLLNRTGKGRIITEWGQQKLEELRILC